MKTIVIEDELKDRIKLRALQENTSMGDIIKRAFIAFEKTPIKTIHYEDLPDPTKPGAIKNPMDFQIIFSPQPKQPQTNLEEIF